MSLDEYIQENRMMWPRKQWDKEQDNRRPLRRSFGGRRPLEGGQWRYEDEEEDEEDEVESLNKRWHDRGRDYGSRGGERGYGRWTERRRTFGSRRPLEGRKWHYEEEDEEDEVESLNERWHDRGRDYGSGGEYSRRRSESKEYEEPAIEDRTGRLMVSNLNPELPVSDLKELFAAIGRVIAVNVHYSRLGESLGTADITYESERSARRAIRHYNGVSLDGFNMTVELLKS